MRSTRLLEAMILAALVAALAWAATRPVRPRHSQLFAPAPNVHWVNQADFPDDYVLLYQLGKSQASLYLFRSVARGWALDPEKARFFVLLGEDKKPHESPSDIRPLDPRLKPAILLPGDGEEPFEFELKRDARGLFHVFPAD